ncbi:MAG: SufD family Fe-S cluster assembly protein [Coriobacteriia bacterium]|nr:SufD family Fe-S cluster assembly protein [Coriobacteriia bacterium]
METLYQPNKPEFQDAAIDLGVVNGLLTSTWNRLQANGQNVELAGLRPANQWAAYELDVPGDVRGVDQATFDVAWAAYEEQAREISAQRLTVKSTPDVNGVPFEAFKVAAADDLDVPARNAIARGAVDAALGASADAVLRALSGEHFLVDVPAYHAASAPVVLRLKAQDGAFACASLDMHVHEGAKVKLVLEADSPAEGAGALALVVRVIADAGARVFIKQQQTLDDSWTYLESIEIKTANSARVDVDQVYLGGKESYLGFGNALLGAKSVCNIDTHYLAAGTSKLDFNYLIRQFGKQSTSKLISNGVLTGASDKVLRGTIDLIHGCKGAVGHELESVLLANKDVRNRTIPIILCDDDDVQGTHGATIGHVPDSQRNYLASRGLDTLQIEGLFLRSLFEHALIDAFDEESARAITRLAKTVLGYDIADAEEPLSETNEQQVQAKIDAKIAAGLAAGLAARANQSEQN